MVGFRGTTGKGGILALGLVTLADNSQRVIEKYISIFGLQRKKTRGRETVLHGIP